MNALAFQTKENFKNQLSVSPSTDLNYAYINTLVPNFSYNDQFGLSKKVALENQLKL